MQFGYLVVFYRDVEPHLSQNADAPSPLDSILDAMLTVSPNKQYRGILSPTTPTWKGGYEPRYSQVMPYKAVCDL